jgi:hypothetical protein
VVKFLMMDYLLVTLVLLMLLVVKFLMMDYLLVLAVLVTVGLGLVL